jgi:hypothetical protein
MKLVDLGLLESVGSTYDQNRTTIQGRVTQRTIDSKPVLGPPPSRFIDVHSDSTPTGAIVPTSTLFASQNSRLFVLGAQSTAPTALLPILLYEFDADSGQHTYVGRINVQLPNSPAIVHTIRSLKVLDGGDTDWKIYIVAVGTVLLSGSGTLLVNKINKSDFVQVTPPTITFATGNDQKAVYQLGRLAANKSLAVTPTIAAGQPTKFNWTAHGFQNNDIVIMTSFTTPAWTASTFAVNVKYFVRNASANDFELSASFNGASIIAAAGPGTVVIQEVNQEIQSIGAIIDVNSNRLYTHAGLITQHQYFVRDISVAPTYSTAPATIQIGTPAKVDYPSHPFVENEPVTFTEGNMPVGFAVGTTYFVRNPQADDFELALTAGGVSINAVTESAGARIGRPFGYTNSQWLYKTSMLPNLVGAILLTDNERLATPTDAPVNGALLNNQPCAFFATASNLYLGRLDELTPETNSWPSLTTSNTLGSLNQIVTPALLHASWADSIDHAIYVAGAATANAFRVVLKKVQNNALTTLFGGACLEWYEVTNKPAYELAIAAPPINFTNQAGWLFVASSSVGQRGIVAVDMRSDQLFDNSYVVSKVVPLPNNAQLRAIKLFEKLQDVSGEAIVYYRTSGFGSISGGWIQINQTDDLESLSLGANQIQFKIAFKTISAGKSSHIQVAGLQIGYESPEQLSDNWEYSFNDSSSASPTRAAFRLKQAYVGSVPSTLAFRAFDLTGVLLVSQTITSNPENFQYSTDGGTTWLPLGTIPNTVGTLVRYSFVSPPGTDVRPSLKDN